MIDYRYISSNDGHQGDILYHLFDRCCEDSNAVSVMIAVGW